MQKMIADVIAYHERFSSFIGDPNNPKIYNGEFRAAFIVEETGETADALEAEDAVEIIDGICDTLYVTIGTLLEFGLIDPGSVPFEFQHIDKPAPTMKLIDDKHEWANRFRTVGEIAAHVIRAGRPLAVIHGELVAVVVMCNAALSTWGLDVRPFWNEVHRSNMEKIPSGKIDVKSIKPPGWQGPRMAPILVAQELAGLGVKA